MRKIIKFSKKFLTYFVVLATIFGSVGVSFLVLPKPLNAATTIEVSTIGLPNENYPDYPIGTSSALAILKIYAYETGSSDYLESIRVDFSEGSSSLRTLLINNEWSGVSLYRDNNGGISTGYFNPDDDILIPLTAASIDWHNMASSSYLILTASSTEYLPFNGSKTFFIVVRVRNGEPHGTRITASIPPYGINTSDQDGPFTEFIANSYMIDIQGPTLINAEKTNSNQVDVFFNERVNTATAQNPSNYMITTGGAPTNAVTDVAYVSDSQFRLTTGIELSTTTNGVQIFDTITDIIGNYSTATTVPITIPKKIKISEFSPYMSDESQEFIEIYNAGSASQEIYNWKLQRTGPYNPNWYTIATVTAATTLNPGQFYLFGSDGFTPTTPDENIYYYGSSDIFSWYGGHIRIIDNYDKEIDRLGWGTAQYPEGTAAASSSYGGYSLERKAYGDSTASDMQNFAVDYYRGNSWDTNNNSYDFVLQSIPNPQNYYSDYELSYTSGCGLMINHMPVYGASIGSPLDIFAQMGDPCTPSQEISAELHWMVGDGNSSDNTPDQYSTSTFGIYQTNGYFKFSIPLNITSQGIYYYLKLVTNSGTKYFSNSPTADSSNNETEVARYPIYTIGQDYTTWSKHNITGLIYDSLNTASSVSNALVFVEGTGYSTTTNSNGYFSINNVKDGNYNLVILKEGYYEKYYNNVYLYGNDYYTGYQYLTPGTGGGTSGDTLKPRVNWTNPADSTIGIMPGYSGQKLLISFSKDIASTTFDRPYVRLVKSTDTSANTLGDATLEYNPTDRTNLPSDAYLGVITLQGNSILTATATYYLILTDGVRDQAGNSLDGNRTEGGHMISFTTGGASGSGWTATPYVTGVSPSNGSMNVAPNTKINIMFSEPMNSSSLTNTNLVLCKAIYSNYTETCENISPAPSILLDNTQKIAIITPYNNSLEAGKYRVKVTGALQSASGVYMSSDYSSTNVVYQSSFEISSTASNDVTRPTISGTWPSDGATNISTVPGSLSIQFSESMDPSTINYSTISLKNGSSYVSGTVNYDSAAHYATFNPTVALSPFTNYVFTIAGTSTASMTVKDIAGNAMANNYVVNFSTSDTMDTTKPKIMYARGTENGIAVTFSKTMNTASIFDTQKWYWSVLNPGNYILKTGASTTDVANLGTEINLADKLLSYDSTTNTVFINNLNQAWSSVNGFDYHINMASTSIIDALHASSSGAADLANNYLGDQVAFRMPVENSTTISGSLAPSTNGDISTVNTYDQGMMKAGVFPMNALAGMTTKYFINIPTYKSIPPGGKIMITFPYGFDIGSAVVDSNAYINSDINGGNSGTIGINLAEANQAARTISLQTTGAATQANDYLHMDITNIINSSIARGPETSGYFADIKTFDANSNLLESIATMPFFINPTGDKTITVGVSGVTSGHNGDVKIYLGSAATGPMEKTVTFNNAISATTSFTSLPSGYYYIYTDPSITLGGNDYYGMTMSESVNIETSSATKTIALIRAAAGSGKADVTINVIGTFDTEDLNFYASSPNGYKVKTLTGATNNPTAHLYLEDGAWMVGMHKAYQTGPTAGTAEMPNWMPPMPVEVIVSGNGASTTEYSATTSDGIIRFNINVASRQIIGYVKDGSSTPIADASVWAYQPAGTGAAASMGANARTDTNGRFVLKVENTGYYKVGTYKEGLPYVPDKSVLVSANNPATADDNATADISVDNTTITTGLPFNIILKKPNYTISGKVTDGTNPVAYASVWAMQANGMGYANAMTDTTGNYILFVDSGTWIVNSYIPGYGEAETQTVVVNGLNMTQNLAPLGTVTYNTVSGHVGINTSGPYSTLEIPLINLPVRAVKYNAQGIYQGKEYFTMTDSDGFYAINVPAGIYRIDTWTQEYGELGINNSDTDNTLNEPEDDQVPDNPANMDLTAGSYDHADIIIDNNLIRNIDLYFNNASANHEGYLKIEGITSSNPPQPTGFSKFLRISDLSATTTVRLMAGNYLFFIDVPGLGRYLPDTYADNPANGMNANGNIEVATTSRQVDFTLPDITDLANAVTISGSVSDGTNPVNEAWVWITNPSSGFRTGTLTNDSGNYSILVPNRTGYKMGADKPGYLSGEQQSLNATSSLTVDFALTAAAYKISGKIYKDANANNSYDPGEEITGGFVRAATTDNTKKSNAPVDGSGNFSLGAVDGTWKVYGMADGYYEASSSNITVSGSDTTYNLKLSLNPNWTNKSKMLPITPSSGGTFDDTAASGTRVKLVIPPNALGSSNSAGNMNSQKTSAVTQTNSSEPLANEGVNINATDNSGQAITNLSDYIDLEMILYKEQIDDAINNDQVEYDELKATEIAYWDSTVNDWVNVATTRTAYYKESGDTEWKLYTNAATTTVFEAFIDTLKSANSYTDYKLVYYSKVNHLTVFAVILPFVATPAQAAPSTPVTPVTPVSAGGGGGSSISYCTSVVYGEWKKECISGYQYRDVVSRTPNNCTITAEQAINSKKECGEVEVIENLNTDNTEVIVVAPTPQAIADARTLQWQQIVADASIIAKGDVYEVINPMGLTRNQKLETDTRAKYTNKLIANVKNLSAVNINALNNFIAYGTLSTKKLGAGERAGVVNSYKSAFGKLPATEGQWKDCIAIGNGRWPNERSANAENTAKASFKKIYRRDANMKNANDNAAVTVIAYGLRPSDRKTKSEANAIKIFKGIFNYNPVTALAWDMVRAIAYSGAKR